MEIKLYIGGGGGEGKVLQHFNVYQCYTMV